MGAYLLWDGGALHFDAVQSETVSLSAQLTKHPVEVGADITDHVRDDPDHVSIDAFVSATPVADVNGVGANVQSTDTGRGFSVDVLRFPAGFDPVRSTMRMLETLKTDATLIDVATHSRFCPAMVLTGISSVPKGTSATFQLSFESIRIVATGTGTANAPKPTQPRDVQKKTTGAQQPVPADTPNRSGIVSLGIWSGVLAP